MTNEKESSFDHTGSTFESFLEEEGILEEVNAVALQRVTDWLKTQSERKAEQ